MSVQTFDLLACLNQFLDVGRAVTSSRDLERLLCVVDTEVKSMHGFLEALVNTDLWRGWYIELNSYKSAIIDVGLEIDRIATLQIEPSYHCKKHTMEVCLMLTHLLKQEGLSLGGVIGEPWATSLKERWQLLLAAASHDLGHPGLINTFPCELEWRSLNLLKNLLIDAGFSAAIVDEALGALEPWILATDHGQYPNLLRCLALGPPAHGDCMAMLLVESDLASSILPNRGLKLTDRLIEEWATPYPEKSIALRNQVGYLSFLKSLQFMSPHSSRAGFSQILNNSLLKFRPPLP